MEIISAEKMHNGETMVIISGTGRTVMGLLVEVIEAVARTMMKQGIAGNQVREKIAELATDAVTMAMEKEGVE